MSDWIHESDWETIVSNMPIPTVDLVVECPDGVVLGRRTNEPAKGEWFVPGGRIHKGERIVDAVDRVAREELGADVSVLEDLGSYEHFYDTSEFGCSKHYITQAYHVWTDRTTFESDDQHRAVEAYSSLSTDLHPYVNKYLEVAGVLDKTIDRKR